MKRMHVLLLSLAALATMGLGAWLAADDYKLVGGPSVDWKINKSTGALLVDSTGGTGDANDSETLRLIRALAASIQSDANTHSVGQSALIAAATAAVNARGADANTHSLALLASMATGLPSGYGYMAVGDGNTNGTALLPTGARDVALRLLMQARGEYRMRAMT